MEAVHAETGFVVSAPARVERLVERELLGGECSYWACMPSKALLRPGEVLAEARRVPAAAGAVTGNVDVDAAFKSRDVFIIGLDDRHQAAWVDSVGADLIRGVGRLVGERRVELEADDGTRRALQARHAVVLATESRAAFPPIEGLDTVGAWDNRDITTTDQVPDRLVVLWGRAQAFKRLGTAEVTVVELFDRLLAVEEPFVGEELRAAFETEGIRVLTEAETTRATPPQRRSRVDAGRRQGGGWRRGARGYRPASWHS